MVVRRGRRSTLLREACSLGGGGESHPASTVEGCLCAKVAALWAGLQSRREAELVQSVRPDSAWGGRLGPRRPRPSSPPSNSAGWEC